jgi:hypothetical protein
MVHGSDAYFFLFLSERNFQIFIMWVSMEEREWLGWFGYITPKNSWLIKWIKITSGDQVLHVQNTDVLKEMMENIVSY